MYKTLLVPADNETTAEKEVNTLFTRLGLFTWQIKGFGPVHDKEAEYKPELPQYKVIVLLTADQVDGFTNTVTVTVKKPAAPAKKPKVKKPAALAKKPAEKKPAAPVKKLVDPVKDKPTK
jgi:hypothetical protein